jgi:uncharacterized protein YkwD
MNKNLKKYALGFLSAIVIVASVVLIFSQNFFESDQKQLQTSILPEVVYNLTNTNRIKEQLPELKINPLLEKAAQSKANDMAEKGYFAHMSPEGLRMLNWLQLVKYRTLFGGENLAVLFSDSEAVVNAWMASESHRRNILNQRFTETGIAVARGVYKGKETLFVVQMFGTPMPTFNR